jgi:DNA primase
VIPDELIAEIRSRTDIVALVSEYVQLKQRGGNHLGLCPFHNEKSPSFNVSQSKQFFHCFGCKESGDAVGFLMRIEGLGFPQAARRLAERAGIELPEFEGPGDEAQRRARAERERLEAVMELATAFYESQLREHPAKAAAQQVLRERGVSAETAHSFRLGFAPPAWDGLLLHMQARGASLQDAETLGLLVRRRDGSGHYDRFRNRVMFPIADVSGQVLAFSGRILPSPPGSARPGDEEAKYINSPETPLYSKGALLFGLHQARVEIRRNGWALLCEGNFDLVALHQAGFRNAVAPLGTAFTAAQAKLLHRSAERVTLMFDGDNAGFKAVQAAHPLLAAEGLSGRVVALPAGADPDSFLREQGAEGLQKLLDRATGIVEFLIDQAASRAPGDAAGRAGAIESLGPLLTQIKNPVEIELHIQRISQRFGVSDLGSLREQLRRGVRAGRKPDARSQSQSNVLPAPARVNLPTLQADLVGVLLERPELLDSPEAKKLERLLTNGELRSIFLASLDLLHQAGKLDASTLLSRLEGNAALSWLRGRLSLEISKDLAHAQEYLRNGLPRLANENYQRELPELDQRIREARQQGDDALANALTRQRNELTMTVHRMMRGLEG